MCLTKLVNQSNIDAKRINDIKKSTDPNKNTMPIKYEFAQLMRV